MTRAGSKTQARRLAAEDGFTIIEVLVSALLVALLAIGVFAALDSASATSGTDKARANAASLAQADQERMRGMKLTDLANLRQTRTQVVDGGTYTIVSRADWVTDASGTASCSSSSSGPDYLKITSTVTENQLRGVRPVVNESIKAVPNGTFGPSQGSLLVQIQDRTGAGVPGVSVSVSGPQNFNETTNSLGCVLLGYLPVGTYTVAFGQTGYVEATLPNRQNVSDQVVVSGQQTSNKTYMYDQAGSAKVNFQTTGFTISNAPFSNTAVPNSTVGATTGESFSVGHSGLGTPFTEDYCSPTDGTLCGGASTPTSVASLQGDGLFPFTSAYAVWAGACSNADPTVQSPAAPANPTFTVNPGVTSPAAVNVREPELVVTVKAAGAAGANQGNALVKVTPTVPGCSTTQTAITPSSGANTGVAAFSLPYGTYTVCAQNSQSSPSRRGFARTLADASTAVNSSASTVTTNIVQNGTGAIVRLATSGTTSPAAC